MKKLTALLIALTIALMALGLSASAEPMSYSDYTDDILEDGSPIYYFPELSLQLPADWAGKVMAIQRENGTSFYQRSSHEKYQEEGINGGGFLFRLSASVNGSFSLLPAFQYLGYSEASSLNYFLELPTDYSAYNDDAMRAEYDALYAGLDFVATHAQFYAQQAEATDLVVPDEEPEEAEAPAPAPQPEEAEAPAQAAQQPAAGNGGISVEKARYHFEHSALPRYFYGDPDIMLDVLQESGVYMLWRSLIDENGVVAPYGPADYQQNWYASDDGTTILQITMPKPEADTQCYRVYLVYHPMTGESSYFTIEYNSFLGDNSFICGWTRAHEHVNYSGAEILDPTADDYQNALLAEAVRIAKLANVSPVLTVAEGVTDGTDTSEPEPQTVPAPSDLVEIPCPEQGFTTMARPEFSWDYKEGTGISIYTKTPGKIPYVIVFQGDDLIMEPFDFIKEQYTPHIQKKYGDDLVYYKEYEHYSLGGKDLPAGVYTYRLQGKMVDLIRVYDSTGNRTVCFTAKYIQGEAEPTLSALHDAIRYFKAN